MALFQGFTIVRHPTIGVEGGGGLSYFFREIPLQIIVESSDGCSNTLVSEKAHSLIPLDAVFTQIQANRGCIGSSGTLMSPFFVKSTPPPTPGW